MSKHQLSREWRWTQVFDKLGRPVGEAFRINLKGGAFK